MVTIFTPAFKVGLTSSETFTPRLGFLYQLYCGALCFASFLWEICISRNNFSFQSTLIHTAIIELSLEHTTKVKQCTASSMVGLHWKALRRGWAKLNSDDSALSNPMKVGAGTLIFYENGRWIRILLSRLEGMSIKQMFKEKNRCPSPRLIADAYGDILYRTISCNEKSRKIGTNLCKFLDNVICKRQLQVEGNSSINEKDRFSTPLMVEQQFFPSLISDSETGDGHGSITPTYVCEICVEPKPLDISFNIKGCSHFYCIECTVKYIKSKLDDNVSRIQCPVTDCEGVLDPDFCREILPRDLFNRWGKALCESALLGSEKLYCPYKDCSALLVNDGEKRIKRFPCPLCKRVFCVQCKVAWHSGADCIKFQKLKNLGSDIMLVDLAKRKKWRQCPNCSIYVEKSAGCCYVKCRCGIAFCYNCGAKSNKVTHFCTQCYH
ncbi:hypothetical protein Gohar_002498 [Gossypium harknessii]|uniref:RBR-type E3 ubiquitin transferase n=1 Tax=Gossypium harknessii TaxID=34285 RepID=A0A7J9HL06_9ROSI|nr:hypothetical protein [Gossypium harknessii]